MFPADARVFSLSQMEINESALTGESLPVTKITDVLHEDTIVADRKNMVFKGTALTKGNGKVIVKASGMKTELGKISAIVQAGKKEEIPLTEKINTFSKKLIIFAVLVTLPVVII